jgi:hypothetical protein
VCRPRLSIWRDGQLQVVRWGNRGSQSRCLPRTGWTWLETIRSGGWRWIESGAGGHPATFVLDGGVWYHVRQGLRGLLVPDELRLAVCYVTCELALYYYKIMTRSDRMPVFIDERV